MNEYVSYTEKTLGFVTKGSRHTIDIRPESCQITNLVLELDFTANKMLGNYDTKPKPMESLESLIASSPSLLANEIKSLINIVLNRNNPFTDTESYKLSQETDYTIREIIYRMIKNTNNDERIEALYFFLDNYTILINTVISHDKISQTNDSLIDEAISEITIKVNDTLVYKDYYIGLRTNIKKGHTIGYKKMQANKESFFVPITQVKLLPSKNRKITIEIVFGDIPSGVCKIIYTNSYQCSSLLYPQLILSNTNQMKYYNIQNEDYYSIDLPNKDLCSRIVIFTSENTTKVSGIKLIELIVDEKVIKKGKPCMFQYDELTILDTYNGCFINNDITINLCLEDFTNNFILLYVCLHKLIYV